jgi:hypothetical protein
MQNNFNDTVNELKDFNLNPSEQVWIEIESNLDDKKKRRIVAWWWIFPLIGLSVIPIFIFNANNLGVSDTKKIVSNNIKNNEKNVQSLEKQKNITAEILINEHSALKSDFSSLQNSSARMQKGLSSTTSASARVQMPLSHKQNGSARTQKGLSHTQSDFARMQVNLTYKQNDSARMQKRLSHTQNSFANVQTDLVSEIVKNQMLQNKNIDTVKYIDSSLSKENAIAKTITKSRKISWSLAIGGGANYVSRNNVFGQKNEDGIYSSGLTSTPTTATSTNPSSNMLSLPKTGYHFSVGVNVEKQLNKKMSLVSGLMYRYLENSLKLNNISVANFLSTRNNFEYKNSLHTIELPIGFKYCVNQTSKNKISLLAGGNIAFAFKKNWLFVNDDLHQYEENYNEINTVLFSLQTAASINFNNKFSLSLIAQKNIISIQKSSSRNYLQQIDFQLNIPFKSLKK